MTGAIGDFPDDTDGSIEENVNVFDARYQQNKQNPLYSSDPDIRRAAGMPVEASPHFDSPVDDDDSDAAARRPRQERPNYGEVWMRVLCTCWWIVINEYIYSPEKSGSNKKKQT